MIQREKLAQFYFAQYRDCAKEMKKKNTDGKKNLEERIERLYKELQNCNNAKISQAHLEEYHRMLRSMAYFAFRSNSQILIMKIRDLMIPELVRLDLLGMSPEDQELITAKFLDYIREKHPYEICQRSLKNMAKNSAESGIRNQIIDMVPTKPETEFPKALEMKRHFVLHIGPTNCGKTYQALERLKKAESGVYLGPLRLLALEVYEKMNDAGIPCTMLTGEERIYEENSILTASTIEMLDTSLEYEVAVIDEAQMIADPDRGHSWTRAILGVQAKEIHICMSPAAEKVVKHLISLCGDTEETHRYERKTQLLCEEECFAFPEDVQEGDAIIAFSKRAVLDIAGRLEGDGIKASVIYGSLPPEIRRRQIHLFTTHQTKVVVSTDAIGMGLNLPVRRIVFAQIVKFDGKETGPLTVETIHQIAGRAGRFGIYDTGYINAVGRENLAFIRENFPKQEQEVDHVSLGFPQVLLDMDEPLDAVLKIWKSVETQPPFEKISIEEVLFLYERAYKDRKEIDGFEDKHTLYRMLTCSIDIKNRDIVELWLYYCKTYTADVSLHFPALMMCTDIGLHKYETFYKLLDLYYQFSVRMGKVIEQERLDKEREKTEEIIMRFLTKDKHEYIRKCQFCGTPIDLSSSSRMCDNCYAEMKSRRAAGERGFGRSKHSGRQKSGDHHKQEIHYGGSYRRYNRHRGDE
ncbi:MAG: ATP-dependent helicase [Lachnospiraceae bacterium]|nr:ATP-dependent helicase [Lachnospiraceae bacterium]